MKNCDEMVSSLLERRERYVCEQKRKEESSAAMRHPYAAYALQRCLRSAYGTTVFSLLRHRSEKRPPMPFIPALRIPLTRETASFPTALRQTIKSS